MTMSENTLCALTATEAAEQLKAGTINAEDLLESCIAQIERIDPAVNAMITKSFEQARKQAKLLDQLPRSERGPLHGLPVAVKDIHATKGIVTTFGSEKLANNIPGANSSIVERIVNAGAIVIGKTNIPESSIGANTVNRLFGATGNPFNPSLTCGGSSGGSGVAVATNMAPLATGSDHGGSLRIPACYSGVVGYRATPGTVPNETRTTPQTNYSVPGPMARSVADIGLLLSVIAKRDKVSTRDPMAYPVDAAKFAQLDEIDISELKVAVSPDLGGVLVSDTIRETFAERVSEVEKLVSVCDLHPIDISSAPKVDWHLRQDLFVSQYYETAQSWDKGFNPNIIATYGSALKTPMELIAAARREQMNLFQRFAEIYQNYDIVLCPGVSIPPFPWQHLNPETIDGKPVENYMAWLALTASLTVVGHPVLALPCGLDKQSTPFGIQVIGPMYQDHKLLSIGHALEAAFNSVPQLCRPVPNFDLLATTETDCRSRGKLVHGQT